MRGRSPASSHPGSLACTSSSLTANRPTITSSGGMPDSSSGRSKVKRVRPVTGSVPTVAIISPMHAGDEALEQRRPRQRRDHAEPQHADREIGRRRERQRDAGQRLGQEHQRGQTDQPADAPRVERDAQRLSGPALLLHRVAVHHGCGGRVGAGGAKQDRGNRAAVFGADVGGGQHHDGHGGIHPVGERQQQRHRDRRRDPWQRAAEDAPHHAAARGGDDPREQLQRHVRTARLRTRTRSPRGCGMPSSHTKSAHRNAAPHSGHEHDAAD